VVGEGTESTCSILIVEKRRGGNDTPAPASGMDGLESALWYGSLAVLAVAVLLPPTTFLHPLVRYALGATALVVLLFLMEGDDDGGGGNEEVVGDVTEFITSREAKREQLREEIRSKILHDAGDAVCRVAAAGAVDVPPPSKNINKDADDGAAKPNDDGGVERINGDSGESREEDAPSADNDNNTNITWRCACENGFLPAGLLKNFGGAEAVMRMGMGQCYHKNGV